MYRKLGPFKKILNWDQHFSSKLINEVVYTLLWVVPVSEISLFVDGIILNTIEFWTGSNPIAMNPGEVETQYVGKDGVSYKN